MDTISRARIALVGLACVAGFLSAASVASAQTGDTAQADDTTPAGVTHTATPAGDRTGRRVLALTLKEAVLRAIRNNPDVDIARIDVAVAYEGIDEADGAFDPAFLGGVNYGRDRNPNFNAPIIPGGSTTISGLPVGLTVNESDQFAWNGGFAWRSQIGTAVSARYDYNHSTTESSFFLDPTVTPGAGINISQPILRGFGYDVNKGFVTIAQTNHEIASIQLENVLQGLAFDVEQAYWIYRGNIAAVEVAEQALKTAQELLERTEAFERVGEAIRLDVLEAQVGVLTREEQVIRTKNNRDNARDGLLRLIIPPGARTAWDVDVLVLDIPRLEDRAFDTHVILAEALTHRPDLRAIEMAIDAEATNLMLAENGRLPQVDLVGSWSNAGLGDSYHNGHKAMFTGDYYSWSVGVEIEVPVFNTSARAAARAAEARVRRAQRSRDSVEQLVVFEVRTSVRNIAAARERVRTTELNVTLAKEQLEREIARRNAELVTNFEVLQIEEDLTDARNARVSAYVDYAISRAGLERVRGNSLRRFSIEIAP